MTRLPTGTVTFLFTDIEGSTRLLTAFGSEWPTLLSRHNAIVRAAIDEHGGVEAKTEGDAFFAVFATASAALAAAVGAQRALAAEPWPPDGAVRVRMGMHAGTGVLSEGDYVGIDVHRAARIAGAANGGQTLISDAARILAAAELPDGTSLRDLGEHRLKDLPGPERLFQVVVDDLPSEFPPVRSLDPLNGGNLPEPSTSFLGRDHELDAIAGLLGDARLVTLTGPGGTGKTRLSIEVARRLRPQFADGVWFVGLDDVRDANLVLPAIASNLAVQEQADRSIEAVLNDHLARRQLLLVLDNLEQIVAAGPAIGRLVAAAPRCRAVASSREPLRVSGEQEYPVPPLAGDPAVDLFVERARLSRPDFVPDEAARMVIAQICQRVDGLPLAIELAAARVRILSPEAILARLGSSLSLLVGGGRDHTERQRTLRGAIAWSYDLLEPAERRFFARFTVFAGSAGIEAVAAVVPDEAGDVAALDACGLLVEKSLLRQFDGPDGEPRFSMLETIREFAAERLTEDPDLPALRERHARWVLDLAERLEPELVGVDPKGAFDLLELEYANIRTAIKWSIESATPEVGLRIGAAIWRFWQHRSHLAEGRTQMTALLDVESSSIAARVRARAMTALGGVCYWQGDFQVADDLYRAALLVYREVGEPRGVALALYDLGFTTAILRDLDEAGRLLEESLGLYLGLGDERMATTVREGIAVQLTIAGRYAEAYEIQLTVIAYYRAARLPFKLEDGLTFVASTEELLGRLVDAREHLRESIGIARAIGDASTIPTQLQVGALVAAGEGQDALAAALVGAFAWLNDTAGPLLAPLKPLNMPDPEELLRARMAPDDFDRAAAEGAAAGVDAMLDRFLDDPRDGQRQRDHEADEACAPPFAPSALSLAGCLPRVEAAGSASAFPPRGCPPPRAPRSCSRPCRRWPMMIAPAWPIRRPGGAVRPAMKETIGTSGRCSRPPGGGGLLGAAADLADQHDALRVRVVAEERQDVDEGAARNRVAADAHAGRLADAGVGHGLHHLVGQRPGAAHQPDVPRPVDRPGDDADLGLAGRGRARAVRPDQPGTGGLDHGHHLEHVVDRDVLGDAEDRGDPCADGLEDRVGRAGGGT